MEKDVSGNRIGGLKAAKRNKELHGEDFYKRIGVLGGEKGTTGGFYYAKMNLPADHHAQAHNAGAIGGRISRRKAKK